MKVKKMNHFSYSLSFFFFFLLHCPILSLTDELLKLQKSLTILSDSFAPKNMLPSYEELIVLVNRAYETKNPQLFDQYQPTIVITTAKYLITDLMENEKQFHVDMISKNLSYIPSMSTLAEKIITKYPNKESFFNCVSLCAGYLENEFLLLRMLKYLGYKNILLTVIDLLYHNPGHRYYKVIHPFKNWCERANIKVKPHITLPKEPFSGINVLFYSNTDQYIHDVLQNKLQKNHLLLMIQPGGTDNVACSVSDFEKNIDNIAPDNFLSVNTKSQNFIDIYFTYDKKDFFVNAKTSEVTKIKEITEFIYNNYEKKELFKSVVEKIFSEWYTKDKVYINYAPNPNLSFVELIRHAAINQETPLAFVVLTLRIKSLINVSGSFKEVYLRYFND